MSRAETIAELTEQCDPYGSLEFAVGSGDDFICFDYAMDSRAGILVMCAVINSETGHFTQNAEDPLAIDYEADPQGAIDAAKGFVSRALDWAADNEVELDMKGWNQDPTYFVRCVERAVNYAPDAKPVARRVRNWSKYL